jgi:predicted chitinase
MCEQFENVIRGLKDTRKHYDNVIHSEDQWLGRLEKISNDFVSLHKNQLKAMEYLSQVCQDSDQFMEIQKSINGMWEVMKVVWVDSLLDGFEN